MIQQSHFCIYIKYIYNQDVKEIVFPCSLKHYSQLPRDRKTFLRIILKTVALKKKNGWGGN